MTVEEKLIANSLEEPAWFAMSATFGRELKAKTFLESKSVKCFVPMKYQIVNDKKQGKIRKLAPAINNLIFVYTTKERIQALKSVAEYLQYLTKTVAGKNIPIIVPEPGKTKKDYRSESEMYSPGIAWGDSPDEIEYAVKTRPDLLKTLDYLTTF